MKKFLIGAFLASSLTAFGNEKCTVQGYTSIFLKNGDVYTNVLISDLKFVTRTKNMEECYLYALNMAKESPTTVPLEVTIGEEEPILTLSYIFFDWTFHDSVVAYFNSKGKLTKYTDQFESYPADGDLRYFSDGRIFN